MRIAPPGHPRQPSPTMRYAITYEIRAVMGPMVKRSKSRLRPGTLILDRIFIEAVLYRAWTVVPWRDLPDDLGDWCRSTTASADESTRAG